MSTPRIAAIPTTYKGVKFRSKLEAAWAEWFDSKEWVWSYEIEGYRLPSGTWYLPDFWLPDLRIFIEVKGVLDDTTQKPIELAAALSDTDIQVYLACAPVGSKFIHISPSGDLSNVINPSALHVKKCEFRDVGTLTCDAQALFQVKSSLANVMVCSDHLTFVLFNAEYFLMQNNDATVNGVPWRIALCEDSVVNDIEYAAQDRTDQLGTYWGREDPRTSRYARSYGSILVYTNNQEPTVCFLNKKWRWKEPDGSLVEKPTILTCAVGPNYIWSEEKWPGYLWGASPIPLVVSIREDRKIFEWYDVHRLIRNSTAKILTKDPLRLVTQVTASGISALSKRNMENY